MIAATRYRLDVTRGGAADRPFGWRVLRRDDAVEVARSTETVGSRPAAMAQGGRRAIAGASGTHE
ncbi:hypothetical protein [Reyranella sp.]|uniref:hypothetical protein n=1 Tax=Reyranella sp. TaxID=1929291 RepID=UPI003F7000C8